MQFYAPRASVLVAGLDGAQEADLAQILGVAIEFLLYGIYIFSFIVSLVIVYRQRRRVTHPAKIFLASNILLFLIATIFTVMGLSRVTQAFVTDPAGPREFFNFPTWTEHWENLAFYILLFLMMNTADALVIYRCYIIWARNCYIVILPILLALSSFAAGIPMFISFDHPDVVANDVLLNLLTSVYPIHFVQNIITTGLIVWKLWNQHRASARAGVRTLGASLTQTARIMIESAMVYTLLLLAMIILDVRQSPFLYTLQYALVPSIGSVFNFISIRVYLAQSSAARMPNTSILPQFNTTSTHGMVDTKEESIILGTPPPPSFGRESRGSTLENAPGTLEIDHELAEVRKCDIRY